MQSTTTSCTNDNLIVLIWRISFESFTTRKIVKKLENQKCEQNILQLKQYRKISCYFHRKKVHTHSLWMQMCVAKNLCSFVSKKYLYYFLNFSTSMQIYYLLFTSPSKDDACPYSLLWMYAWLNLC